MSSEPMEPLEPLPQVREAVDDLALVLETTVDLPAQLEAVSAVAKALVPSTLGVSLSVFVDGESFTLTATAPEAAVIDAGQYLDEAGPCLEAISSGDQVRVDDVLDEEQWQLYRHSSTTVGIRSSLSLPLRDDEGGITGGLNLYAAEPDAFSSVEAMLAEIFGTQVGELVRNADLTFRTRDWARQLPERLAARKTVEIAVGVLMAAQGWSPDDARARLRSAAQRAGVPIERVADVVTQLTS